MLLAAGTGLSQNSVNEVLKQILQNNPSLASAKTETDARRAEYRTGLSLRNPAVSYDYLFGNPASVGNETEINVDFSFDFPTAYGERNSLSEMRVSQLAERQNAAKYRILSEAKTKCIELIYYYKRRNILKDRYETAERIKENSERSFAAGEINIVELNRSKLQVINHKSDIELNERKIKDLNLLLNEMNGGVNILFYDTAYPSGSLPVDIAALESDIENSDPVLKSMIAGLKTAEQEVKLQKALNLPKIELGYRYKSLQSTSFNGFHVGVSVPLWEGSNTVKHRELEVNHIQALIISYRNEISGQIKRSFENAVSLSKSLNEMKNEFDLLKAIELYEKSLLKGEMTSTEFLIETTYYNSIQDKIEDLELEYQLSLTNATKHRLLREF